MRHIRNVPWELADIVPDFVLGRTTCAMFLRYPSSFFLLPCVISFLSPCFFLLLHAGGEETGREERRRGKYKLKEGEGGGEREREGGREGGRERGRERRG